jgi:hypothetical protein
MYCRNFFPYGNKKQGSVEQNENKTNFKNKKSKYQQNIWIQETDNQWGTKKYLHNEQLHNFYDHHNYYSEVNLFYNQLDVQVTWRKQDQYSDCLLGNILVRRGEKKWK